MSVRLETPRLVLREPEEADAFALLRYHHDNEERFAPFEPENADEIEHHLRWVRWRRAQSVEGTGRALLAFDRDAPLALAGIVNVYAIGRDAPGTAVIGYSVDGAYEGRGIMHEAVSAAIAYAFGTLGLTRLEADYDPKNVRSAALLGRLGFVVEGFARGHVRIRGTLRDHVRTALANPASGPPAPA